MRNGHIKRITDNDIRSSVLEVMSTNVSTTFISCPGDATKTLGIKLPFLVMLIKNLKKYFSFEVQVLDDKNVRRRFRASNYQARCALLAVLPFITPSQVPALERARARGGAGSPPIENRSTWRPALGEARLAPDPVLRRSSVDLFIQSCGGSVTKRCCIIRADR